MRVSSDTRLLAGVVVIAFVVFVGCSAKRQRVLIRPDGTSTTLTLKDCRFISVEKKIGIDFDLLAKKIDKLSLKLNLSMSEVREMDTLLRDYGAKYETACRDYVMGAIAQDEYNCRRDNMDKALGNIRGLQQSLSAIEKIKDSSSQVTVAAEAIRSFKEFAKDAYSKGCGSSITVNPRNLTFSDSYPERSIEVTNSGNRQFDFSVVGLPESFRPSPRSGPVAKGQTVTVALHRQPLPVKPGAVEFWVRNNFHDEVSVKINVDAENAGLFKRWGSRPLGIYQGLRPTLDEAIAIVDRLPHRPSREATRYLLAAGILLEAQNPTGAQEAFQTAVKQDGGIPDDPAAQLFWGLIEYKLGAADNALQHFQKASSLAGLDPKVRAGSALFSGALLASRGKESDAAEQFRVPGVQERAREDSRFRKFLEKLFQINDLQLLVSRLSGSAAIQ